MSICFRSLAAAAWIGAAAAVSGCAALGTGDADTPAPAQAQGFVPAPEGALYGFGYALGGGVSAYELDDAEMDRVVAGLRDRVSGRDSRYGELSSLNPLIGQFLVTRKQEVAARTRAAAQPFLEAEAAAEGAITTEAGVIVRVLEAGQGEAPGPEQWVSMHYDATLSDGTPVHAMRGGEPYLLKMPRANLCWREAMAFSAPGARLRVVCPPDTLVGLHEGWLTPGAVMVWNLDILEVSDP